MYDDVTIGDKIFFKKDGDDLRLTTEPGKPAHWAYSDDGSSFDPATDPRSVLEANLEFHSRTVRIVLKRTTRGYFGGERDLEKMVTFDQDMPKFIAPYVIDASFLKELRRIYEGKAIPAIPKLKEEAVKMPIEFELEDYAWEVEKVPFAYSLEKEEWTCKSKRKLQNELSDKSDSLEENKEAVKLLEILTDELTAHTDRSRIKYKGCCSVIMGCDCYYWDQYIPKRKDGKHNCTIYLPDIAVTAVKKALNPLIKKFKDEENSLSEEVKQLIASIDLDQESFFKKSGGKDLTLLFETEEENKAKLSAVRKLMGTYEQNYKLISAKQNLAKLSRTRRGNEK